MFSRFAVVALACLAAVTVQANVINQDNGDVRLSGAAGRKLVQNSRKAAQNNNAYYYGGGSQYDGNYDEIDWDSIDTSYLAGYSLKFQGCHHVQQWNDEAQDEEGSIKIMTQRLVRFRMCPTDSCSSVTTRGCDKNYGDYLVDMETYVEAYMEQMQEQMQEQYMNQNQYYRNQNNNRDLANNNNNNNNNWNSKYNINFEDYLTCQEMELDNRQRNRARELRKRRLANNNNNQYYNQYYQEEDVSYYIGPYCAEQGGEIRLGVFYDDTCSVFADDGEELFELVHNGMSLPYSKKSVVSLDCISCGGYGEVNELCQGLYEMSGKCETKMDLYYPNESACTYLDGIKVIREDGVIRTSATRKSTAAAVSTGLFLTAAVLLSAYVYYLRTKLGRARINLEASQSNAGLL